MALYCYLKATPGVKKQFPFLPVGLVTVGLFLVGNAAWPILAYQLRSIQFRRQIVAPVASVNIDYTNLRNWFPKSHQLPPRATKITHYSLSIPKLKIDRAVVHIGGEDLAQGLIHYPDTALPGQYGNTVVFGHSVLPQFFNPKNYKTIFSTLPTLEEGDEILVDFDGINYRYRVVRMVEVASDDISILEQQYDTECLSLVTCVPPGTYLRRLVVKSKLVPI